MPAYLGILLLTAAFTITAIWSSWKRYWPEVWNLQRQLAAGPQTQELRFSITNVEVRRPSAVIHRPQFNQPLTQEQLGPQANSARRAA